MDDLDIFVFEYLSVVFKDIRLSFPKLLVHSIASPFIHVSDGNDIQPVSSSIHVAVRHSASTDDSDIQFVGI